jgi:hypothetical protein
MFLLKLWVMSFFKIDKGRKDIRRRTNYEFGLEPESYGFIVYKFVNLITNAISDFPTFHQPSTINHQPSTINHQPSTQ